MNSGRPVLHPRLGALSFPASPSPGEPDLVPDPAIRRLHLNESPLPPSPRVVEAVAAAVRHVGYYPDHTCTALAGRLSRLTGVPAECMSFGNGSGELLVAGALATVGPGDEAVLPTPTFPTCGKGVQIAGARAVEVPVRDDGVVDVEATLAAIGPRTRLVYVCTPNNPTGGALTREELDALVRGVPDDTLLLVDEAYHEFAVFAGAPDALDALRGRRGPWAVTRTFSKAFSLAGLRVGYVLASERDVADAFWKLRPNFNVGRVALAAACAAFDDADYGAAIVRSVSLERERLAGGLRALGLRVLPSATNFVMTLPDAPAAELARALGARGLTVQAMPWRGGSALRISVGTAEDTDAVLAGLRAALPETV
ncbi:histidinol-phosphate transaminase [Arenibaculum sp.]|uniref:pyridoxal phosphate-dependent aminotransferase n=1 Tax=Arenibaculum sp. TaxID=2865862 RepID=UPI002E0E58FD|nr:histidinol-phosphate transaminase [Arenibaculum sp.]